MSTNAIVVLLLGALIYLDAAAIYYSIKTEMYTKGQLVGQACVVLLIPFLGAILILSFSLTQISSTTFKGSEAKFPSRLLSNLFLGFLVSRSHQSSKNDDSGTEPSTLGGGDTFDQ